MSAEKPAMSAMPEALSRVVASLVTSEDMPAHHNLHDLYRAMGGLVLAKGITQASAVLPFHHLNGIFIDRSIVEHHKKRKLSPVLASLEAYVYGVKPESLAHFGLDSVGAFYDRRRYYVDTLGSHGYGKQYLASRYPDIFGRPVWKTPSSTLIIDGLPRTHTENESLAIDIPAVVEGIGASLRIGRDSRYLADHFLNIKPSAQQNLTTEELIRRDAVLAKLRTHVERLRARDALRLPHEQPILPKPMANLLGVLLGQQENRLPAASISELAQQPVRVVSLGCDPRQLQRQAADALCVIYQSFKLGK